MSSSVMEQEQDAAAQQLAQLRRVKARLADQLNQDTAATAQQQVPVILMKLLPKLVTRIHAVVAASAEESSLSPAGTAAAASPLTAGVATTSTASSSTSPSTSSPSSSFSMQELQLQELQHIFQNVQECMIGHVQQQQQQQQQVVQQPPQRDGTVVNTTATNPLPVSSSPVLPPQPPPMLTTMKWMMALAQALLSITTTTATATTTTHDDQGNGTKQQRQQNYNAIVQTWYIVLPVLETAQALCCCCDDDDDEDKDHGNDKKKKTTTTKTTSTATSADTDAAMADESSQPSSFWTSFLLPALEYWHTQSLHFDENISNSNYNQQQKEEGQKPFVSKEWDIWSRISWMVLDELILSSQAKNDTPFSLWPDMLVGWNPKQHQQKQSGDRSHTITKTKNKAYSPLAASSSSLTKPSSRRPRRRPQDWVLQQSNGAQVFAKPASTSGSSSMMVADSSCSNDDKHSPIPQALWQLLWDVALFVPSSASQTQLLQMVQSSQQQASGLSPAGVVRLQFRIHQAPVRRMQQRLEEEKQQEQANQEQADQEAADAFAADQARREEYLIAREQDQRNQQQQQLRRQQQQQLQQLQQQLAEVREIQAQQRTVLHQPRIDANGREVNNDAAGGNAILAEARQQQQALERLMAALQQQIQATTATAGRGGGRSLPTIASRRQQEQQRRAQQMQQRQIQRARATIQWTDPDKASFRKLQATFLRLILSQIPSSSSSIRLPEQIVSNSGGNNAATTTTPSLNQQEAAAAAAAAAARILCLVIQAHDATTEIGPLTRFASKFWSEQEGSPTTVTAARPKKKKITTSSSSSSTVPSYMRQFGLAASTNTNNSASSTTTTALSAPCSITRASAVCALILGERGVHSALASAGAGLRGGFYGRSSLDGPLSNNGSDVRNQASASTNLWETYQNNVLPLLTGQSLSFATSTQANSLRQNGGSHLQRSGLSFPLALRLLGYIQENLTIASTDLDRGDWNLFWALAQPIGQMVGLSPDDRTLPPIASGLTRGRRWTIGLHYKLFRDFIVQKQPESGDNEVEIKSRNDRTVDGGGTTAEPEWFSNIRTKCWETGMQVLTSSGNGDSVVATFGNGRRGRGSAAFLIQENRRQISHRNPSLKDCFESQSEAFEMIGYLVDSDKIRRTSEQGRESSPVNFDLLLQVMQCLDSNTYPAVAPALRQMARCVLQTYSKEAQSMADLGIKAARDLVNGILFPLIGASTSTSETVREMAVEVAVKVLGTADSLPAWHLCEYFTQDESATVSNKAKKLLKTIAPPENALAKPIQVNYLNLAKAEDQEKLKREMYNRASLVATTFNLPIDAAFVLLRKEHYSVMPTVSSLQNEYLAFIKGTGLVNRLAKGIGGQQGVDDSEFTCEICYEDFPCSESFALPCDHFFCKECWSDAIDATFSSAESPLSLAECPRHDCNERMIRTDIEALSLPKQLGKWDRASVEDFVHKSWEYSFCPGADCTVVACLGSDSLRRNYPAGCVCCKNTFCFQCGNAPHRPATCEVVKRYEEIMKDFKELDFLVKECPSCSVQIQKNGGCNHMTCKQCGHEFCWVCLSSNWSDHNCNIYQDMEQEDDNRRARFFSNRVNVHRRSEELTLDLLENLDGNVRNITNRVFGTDEEELFQILNDALNVSIKARNFLSNSYIAAFGLNRDDAYRKEFEMHQGQVETLTERLSQLIESVANHMQYQSVEGKGMSTRLKSIVVTSGALWLYIRRIDLFMANFMS